MSGAILSAGAATPFRSLGARGVTVWHFGVKEALYLLRVHGIFVSKDAIIDNTASLKIATAKRHGWLDIQKAGRDGKAQRAKRNKEYSFWETH